MLAAAGDRADALAEYRASFSIREKLVATDPGNAQWQRDLALSNNRIGEMLDASGDRTGALAAYRAFSATSEKLAAADPGNGR